MKFDRILDNETLWAVRYDDADDNVLHTLFDQWSDPEWLVDFFPCEHIGPYVIL